MDIPLLTVRTYYPKHMNRNVWERTYYLTIRTSGLWVKDGRT